MSVGTNTPYGFKPIRVSNNSNSTFSTNDSYQINPASSSAIYIGDLVGFDSNGWIVPLASSGSYQTVVGVFAGCQYLGQGGAVNLATPAYFPGSVTAPVVFAKIWTDPSIIYSAQVDGAGATQAQLGTARNCNFTVTAPTTPSLGYSAWSVTSGSFLSTTTLPLKYIGLAPSSTNTQNAYGVQYNQVLVMLNTPLLAPNTAGN